MVFELFECNAIKAQSDQETVIRLFFEVKSNAIGKPRVNNKMQRLSHSMVTVTVSYIA